MKYQLFIYLNKQLVVAGIPLKEKVHLLQFDGKDQFLLEDYTLEVILKKLIEKYHSKHNTDKTNLITTKLLYSTQTESYFINIVNDCVGLKVIETQEVDPIDTTVFLISKSKEDQRSESIFTILESFTSDIKISLIYRDKRSSGFRRTSDKLILNEDIQLFRLKKYIVQQFISRRGAYYTSNEKKISRKVKQFEPQIKKWLLQLQQTPKPVCGTLEIEPGIKFHITLNKKEPEIRKVLNSDEIYLNDIYGEIIKSIDNFDKVTDVAFVGNFDNLKGLIPLFEKRKLLKVHTKVFGWNDILFKWLEADILSTASLANLANVTPKSNKPANDLLEEEVETLPQDHLTNNDYLQEPLLKTRMEKIKKDREKQSHNNREAIKVETVKENEDELSIMINILTKVVFGLIIIVIIMIVIMNF